MSELNGLASLKAARKEKNIMQNNREQERSQVNAEQVYVNPAAPPVDHFSNYDDIEVIDLDNPRGQIKPTTWHQ